MTGEQARPDIRLRPARDDDWSMIRRWLAQPEIVRWWGPKATSEAEVMLAMASTQAICRIIEAGGAPVGYAHAHDASLTGEPLPKELPAGAWTIDLFVAAPQHRGKGVGAAALALVRDEIFATTLALEAAVFISVANERAVRACESTGFRWRAVVHDRAMGPQWLMSAERPQRR